MTKNHLSIFEIHTELNKYLMAFISPTFTIVCIGLMAKRGRPKLSNIFIGKFIFHGNHIRIQDIFCDLIPSPVCTPGKPIKRWINWIWNSKTWQLRSSLLLVLCWDEKRMSIHNGKNVKNMKMRYKSRLKIESTQRFPSSSLSLLSFPSSQHWIQQITWRLPWVSSMWKEIFNCLASSLLLSFSYSCNLLFSVVFWVSSFFDLRLEWCVWGSKCWRVRK